MIATDTEALRSGRRMAHEQRLPVNIERCSPRCRHHAYLWLTNKDSPATSRSIKPHAATCVRCSHGWPCRVLERDR